MLVMNVCEKFGEENWCVIDNEVSGLCNVYEKKEENVWCGYKIFFVILVRCI